MSIFSSYKKIFLLGFIIVILIAIPFSVYIAQKRQQITSKAAASTQLSFEPASKTVKVGDILRLSIMLNPGAGTPPNQVSFVKLTINFDPAKFTTIPETTTDGSLKASSDSSNTLTTIIEDPKYESGKASISLSVGADPTRVVTAETEIAILQLKAIASTTPTNSSITFDVASNNTQVLSIAPSDQTSENVLKNNMLSTTNTATITIDSATTTTTPTLTPTPTSALTPTPTGTSSTPSGAPTCASLNVDRSATGTAPYSLTFTVAGNDSNGTVSKASFNFGDGPIQDITTGGGLGTNSVNAQISHAYANAGIYTAYAILTDNNNNLSAQQDSCTKTITVNAAQASSGSGSTQTTTQPLPTQATLPPTGPGTKILGIGAIGAVLTLIGGALLMLL